MAEKLSKLEIDGLYNLYRQWPHRHEERLLSGREHLTFYFEGRIIRELQRRHSTTRAEHQKIDYCSEAYKGELINMARIFGIPVGNIQATAPSKTRNPEELAAVIRQYADYKTIADREILIEYTDSALETIDVAPDKQTVAELAAELAELDRKKIIRIPQKVYSILYNAVNDWLKHPRVPDTEMVMPLMTLSLLNNDLTFERKAIRIINRCYKACLDSPTDADLRIAITFREYLPRFSRNRLKTCSAATQ